jgi:glycine/D-amino acid oxidase-like deaminating enzyme
VRFLFNREVLSLHGAPRIERVRLRAATPDEADDRPKRERQERRGRATSPFSPDDAQSGAGGAPTPQAAPGGAAAGAGGRDAPMAPAPAPEEDVEEDLEVDELVLAAGVWSEGLARDAGVRLPMRAGKGYSVTLRYPPQTLSVPAILSEARVAITPMGVALRVGGTMEVLSAETAERGGINNARVRGLLGAVADYLPVLERERFEGLPVWYGLRPTTPDGLPYIGRSPRHDNLVIATGHAMMGMSLGPITGELVAELLAGDPPSLPLEALRVDRFG